MRFVASGLMAMALAVPLASAQSPPGDLAHLIAGIMVSGQVVVAASPLSSGHWGTDYITVSHALRVGRRYTVLQGSPPAADARPVLACSSLAHGIDILVLRVTAHKSQPAIEWGDPVELKAGDELIVFPRKEFHHQPVKIRFMHQNYLEWRRLRPDEVPHQWHNVMVAEGFMKPGFSGSPWVRNGRVVGLTKGIYLPSEQNITYGLAETATRVKQCLKEQHYDELVPRE